MKKKVVVLVSGGLDSATALAYAWSAGYECHGLSFDYGQRHKIELESAKKVCAQRCVSHLIIETSFRGIGGSALTSDMEVPKDRPLEAMGEGIPVTYVPARNTIFLAYALGYAEVLGAEAIYIGANQLDYSGYPDCRGEFFKAFESLAAVATAQGLDGKAPRIVAPLLNQTKAQIIRNGKWLGVDYSVTHSCYDPQNGKPCGKCDSCILRAKGFAEAGMEDPALV
jgi:7-cyano-7-deazaguanine synthase